MSSEPDDLERALQENLKLGRKLGWKTWKVRERNAKDRVGRAFTTRPLRSPGFGFSSGFGCSMVGLQSRAVGLSMPSGYSCRTPWPTCIYGHPRAFSIQPRMIHSIRLVWRVVDRGHPTRRHR